MERWDGGTGGAARTHNLSPSLCCGHPPLSPPIPDSSYLLLIRYEAVSSTPVMGLEMVALRSCEARDMIYPHPHTRARACVLAAWL